MATARPTQNSRGRKWRWLLVLLAALAIVLGGWLYANRDQLRFTFFAEDAGDLQAQLVRNSGLTVAKAGKVRRLDADGTQPDTAVQSLVLSAAPAAVRAGFTRACRQAGLRAADRDTLAAQPDVICSGRWHDGSATVELVLDCAQACRAELGVYHLWF